MSVFSRFSGRCFPGGHWNGALLTLTDGANRGHWSTPFPESIAVGGIFCSMTLRVVRDSTRTPSNIWGVIMNNPWFPSLIGPWVAEFLPKQRTPKRTWSISLLEGISPDHEGSACIFSRRVDGPPLDTPREHHSSRHRRWSRGSCGNM